MVITSAIADAARSSAPANGSLGHRQRSDRPLRGAAASGSALTQEVGDPQQVVRQHRRADEHLEPLAPLQWAASHAAAAQEDRDAAFDAGAEALPLL